MLVERGLASSQEKAKALIYAGKVLVNRQAMDKPGRTVDPQAALEVKEPESPYVSRGGVKLEKALEAFNLAVSAKVALDIGASTGGFTHCLLTRGIKRVHAVDVGYGQLAWEVRQDPRVRVLERKNVRFLKAQEIGETADLAVVDTSFISLRLVIPALLPLISPDASIVALIKPQFEVGKGKVGKGGVVRNPEDQARVVEELSGFFKDLGLEVLGLVESPLLGAKGNKEFFIHLKKGTKFDSD